MLTEEVQLAIREAPGALSELFHTLAKAGVETLGVATERSLEGGRAQHRVHLLLRDRTEGAAALKNAGYAVRVRPVLYLQVEASVARLDWALSRLHEAGIEVETLYHAYAPGGPGLVLVVENPRKAAELL